jgi:Xaa-Pro dipeptidase
MFAGYQPILGNTFCLISLTPAHELEMRLAVPVDEQDMVPQTGIKEVRTFTEETMTYISTTLDSVCKPLGEILRAAGLNEGAVVGIEGGRSPIIPAYTQVGMTGPETRNLLHLLLLGGEYRDATSLLDELAAIKTE